MDQEAELEIARKAQLEEKERSRAEHRTKVVASAAVSAPKAVKAKPQAKRKKT